MMKEQANIREELKAQQAERLLAHQGRLPEWKLPDGYLDEMTERALSHSNKLKALPSQRPYRRFFSKIAAAAAIVLAMAAWYFYPTEPASLPIAAKAAEWEGIATEDLQAYVNANLDEFELELLAAYTLETTEEQLSFPGAGISTEALENYLEADDWLLEAELPDIYTDEL